MRRKIFRNLISQTLGFESESLGSSTQSNRSWAKSGDGKMLLILVTITSIVPVLQPALNLTSIFRGSLRKGRYLDNYCTVRVNLVEGGVIAVLPDRSTKYVSARDTRRQVCRENKMYLRIQLTAI